MVYIPRATDACVLVSQETGACALVSQEVLLTLNIALLLMC